MLKKKNIINSRKKRSNFLFIDKNKIRFCRLFVRKSYTNLFFTLTDLKNKVVKTLSTGQCCDVNNKRVKKSPVTLENMMVKIRKNLNKLKIRCLELIIRSKLRAQLKTINRQLTDYGFRIIRIKDRRIAAHNGVRGRNIRRN